MLEAWLAGRIAVLLSASAVRLHPQERPDFELRFGEEVRQYELTEADILGRRRGDESFEPGIQDDPVEDWRIRFEAIAPSLKDRIEKKIRNKNYDAKTSLVVYVNLGCYGAYMDEGITILREETGRAKNSFQEVFAYWEGALFRFWQHGCYKFERWLPPLAHWD